MYDHLTPRSQVLERLDEKYQPLARKLKFLKGWFVEDKDGRQLWMRKKSRIRIAQRFDREQDRLWRGTLDDRGGTVSGC
jgi:hypothetical protein